MKHYFAEKHPSFVYKKTLGWGGNGMAAEFDQLDANGKPARSVVVKMLFSDNVESMEVETDNCEFFYFDEMYSLASCQQSVRNLC